MVNTDLILKECEKRELNKKQLAEHIGVQPKVIYRLMTTRSASIETIAKVGKFLEINAYDMLSGR